jgi:putative methanogenesis marker 16 metalloprotein
MEEIREKINTGKAVVLTASELCELTKRGKEIKFEDVDVITTATKGLMSGTAAILAFRVSEPKKFKKVKTLSMNGINCYVGPCPNETLGLVDLILYATDRSEDDPNYGAGHLLRDLVEKKQVHVYAKTIEGMEIHKNITIDDIYFAEMMGIRHGFRNYSAFTNPGPEHIKSIFSVVEMGPNYEEISVCGCGAVNPYENDPNLDILGVGTSILLNGAPGYIIGAGTRATVGRPNMMTKASLFDMIPEFMGGFVTSEGPEVICSIAVPIPILNEDIFNKLKKTDDKVPLNVVDIVGRNVLGTVDYGQVWKKNLVIGFKNNFCASCELKENCPIEEKCPTKSFSIEKGINRTKCFNCGTCLRLCPYKAFNGNLGEVKLNGHIIPIKLRQSDKNGAIKAMEDLKKRILSGKFQITLPVAKPKIYTEKI